MTGVPCLLADVSEVTAVDECRFPLKHCETSPPHRPWGTQTAPMSKTKGTPVLTTAPTLLPPPPELPSHKGSHLGELVYDAVAVSGAELGIMTAYERNTAIIKDTVGFTHWMCELERIYLHANPDECEPNIKYSTRRTSIILTAKPPDKDVAGVSNTSVATPGLSLARSIPVSG